MDDARPGAAAGRRAFLDRRRRINVERMDRIFAPIYDANWGGYINPMHAAFVDELVRLTRADSTTPWVLDAACGTGKYWPTLQAAGVRVVGVDHSVGMLERARAKYPEVETYRLALQEVSSEPRLAGRFDGLLCVDALENVGPEDWPVVLRALISTLRAGAPAYVTIELPDEDDDEDEDDEVLEEEVPDATELVDGERLHAGAYHYFPSAERVAGWLEDAGLRIVRQDVGDGYLHVLCRR